MPSLMENVSIATQAIRTLLAVVVVGTVGGGVWYGSSLLDSRDREVRQTAAALKSAQEDLAQTQTALAARDREIASLQADLDRLDAAMRLLKVDHRVALLAVREQREDPATGQLISVIDFQELDDSGEAVGALKQYEIGGDIVFVDSWIVKFEDKYVEQADLHRSTSLVLFRRIFGENQKPSEAFSLDEAGSRPQIYSHGRNMTDWERQIWDDFWSVANDRQRQVELGIRAAHGEALSIKVRKGKAYRISVRASDGLSVLIEEPPAPKLPPPA